MSLYTEVLGFVTEAKSFNGRRGRILRGPGVSPPSTSSVKVTWRISHQGQRATSAFSPLNFYNGASMAKAKDYLSLEGVLNANTLLEYALDMLLTENIVRRVKFQYKIQANDTYDLALTGLAGCLAGANDNGVAPENCFIRGLGPNDNALVLKAAMNNLFGSDSETAFVVDDSVLTINVGTNGLAGNFLSAITKARNSMPGPLLNFSDKFAVQQAGFRDDGEFDGFKIDIVQDFQSYVPGNTGAKKEVPTTFGVQIAFGHYANLSTDIIAGASGLNALTNDATHDVILIGGGSAADVNQLVRTVFAFEDELGTAYVDAYGCQFGNVPLELKVDSIAPLIVACKPQIFPTRSGDPLGVIVLPAA